MQSKVISQMEKPIREAFGPEMAAQAIALSQQRFSRLVQENDADPKAVKEQTHSNLFPCMALYDGLRKAGVSQEAALEFLDKQWSIRAEPQAAAIRGLLKIPGLYKLMPRLYRMTTLRSFGAEAGFRAVFYPTGKDRCKFDMTRCLYCDVCKRYGVPELVKCFCHTDDVTSGRMHPRILWNRTKTMGEGGDVCDFDIIVTKK